MSPNNEIDLVDLYKKVKNNWRTIVKFGVIGLLLGVVVALSKPNEYSTIIEFAPESNSKSQNQSSQLGGLYSMRGMTNLALGGSSSSSSDGVSIRIYPRIIESTPYLMEFYEMKVPTKNGSETLNEYLKNDIKAPWWSYIMGAPGVLMGLITDSPEAEAGEENSDYKKFTLTKEQQNFKIALRSRCEIDLDEKTWTIKISAKMQDPLVAAVVADSMMTTLQRYMSNYWLAKSRSSLANAQNVYNDAYTEYMTAQVIFARASDANKGLIKESAKIDLDQLRNNYNVAYSAYQLMANQLLSAKLKLQEDSHIATIIEPSYANKIPSSRSKKTTVLIFTFIAIMGCIAVLVAKEVVYYP